MNQIEQPRVKEWAATMKERYGWTIRTIAEKAGIAHGTVGAFYNPQSRVGFNACIAMARIFGTPERTVLELADLLSPEPVETQDTRLLTSIYHNLSEEDRRELVSYAEYLRDGKRTLSLSRFRGKPK